MSWSGRDGSAFVCDWVRENGPADVSVLTFLQFWSEVKVTTKVNDQKKVDPSTRLPAHREFAIVDISALKF